MPDPKKPAEEEQPKPADMSYPTPELDPNTGAPIDQRFVNRAAASQEAPAQQQAPKSGSAQTAQAPTGAPAKPAGTTEEEDDEDEDDGKAGSKTKTVEKPKRRR